MGRSHESVLTPKVLENGVASHEVDVETVKLEVVGNGALEQLCPKVVVFRGVRPEEGINESFDVGHTAKLSKDCRQRAGHPGQAGGSP